MLRFLKVSGVSLEPEYHHGDYVLVARLPGRLASYEPGAAVAFRQPGYGLLIKKVARVDPGGCLTVIGLGASSVDSRDFGPVQPEAVLGRVIWHIRKP